MNTLMRCKISILLLHVVKIRRLWNKLLSYFLLKHMGLLLRWHLVTAMQIIIAAIYQPPTKSFVPPNPSTILDHRSPISVIFEIQDIEVPNKSFHYHYTLKLPLTANNGLEYSGAVEPEDVLDDEEFEGKRFGCSSKWLGLLFPESVLNLLTGFAQPTDPPAPFGCRDGWPTASLASLGTEPSPGLLLAGPMAGGETGPADPIHVAVASAKGLDHFPPHLLSCASCFGYRPLASEMSRCLAKFEQRKKVHFLPLESPYQEMQFSRYQRRDHEPSLLQILPVNNDINP
ncbi:ATP-dependent helicase BRM [Senna tora]|uniref:ATP-dependent helicase BRM n=1 Tax=Senna tora TaxID=362788 RepID=A0A835CLI5_9FABA|nr:ATP-dependent helicase BRM [Senna tora]